VKTARYKRYKCYKREGGLAERLAKSKWKLPRGKDGRPAKTPTWGDFGPGIMVRRDAELLSAWYGEGADFELCETLAFSTKHPRPAVRKEAQVVIFDRISQALAKGDRTIFHRLADSMKAVQEAPRHPLAVAVVLSHQILVDGGNPAPQPAEIVRKAGERFAPPQTAKELESLNASLFRETKKFLTYLNSLEAE
jgi:hypothetical protein